jgi:hypothetical protein
MWSPRVPRLTVAYDCDIWLTEIHCPFVAAAFRCQLSANRRAVGIGEVANRSRSQLFPTAPYPAGLFRTQN